MAQAYPQAASKGCEAWTRHKTFLLSPHRLRVQGIPVHEVVQYPGEFVLTLPESYHAGFNHGFNLAEATNFAFASWLPAARRAKVCKCDGQAAHIDVDWIR